MRSHILSIWAAILLALAIMSGINGGAGLRHDWLPPGQRVWAMCHAIAIALFSMVVGMLKSMHSAPSNRVNKEVCDA